MTLGSVQECRESYYARSQGPQRWEETESERGGRDNNSGTLNRSTSFVVAAIDQERGGDRGRAKRGSGAQKGVQKFVQP